MLRKPREPKPPIKEYKVPIELHLNQFNGLTLRQAFGYLGLNVENILDAVIIVDYDDCDAYSASDCKLIIGQKTIDNTQHPNYPLLLEEYNQAMARYQKRLKEWEEQNGDN